MPELPEVETTCRGIAPHLVGRRVTGVVVRQPQLRWPVPGDLAECITGERIERVWRRAKYILVELPSGHLILHLGMTGSLRVVPVDEIAQPHDHVDIAVSGSQLLRLRDPRRFGAVLWTTQPPDAHPLLARLGPEPLSEVFSGEYLYRRARGRQIPVKSFIMDGKVVVGVGNIYANESLYMAGIHPGRAAGRISLARFERLVEVIKLVLGRSIQLGGTTLRDFVNGDGKPGYFQQSLLVYGRGGESCRRCEAALTEIRMAQRTTVYCPKCQR